MVLIVRGRMISSYRHLHGASKKISTLVFLGLGETTQRQHRLVHAAPSAAFTTTATSCCFNVVDPARIQQLSLATIDSTGWDSRNGQVRHCATANDKTVMNNQDEDDKDDNVVLYEGPFAKLTLRLKRVSITTAIVSLVGIPILISASATTIPLTGQWVVGGTALLAATGSTMAMSFCFSPYVHTLEQIPVRKCLYKKKLKSGEQEVETKVRISEETQHYLVKAKTRNVCGFLVETVFDPTLDLKKPKNSIRPFCNILAKGFPLYIHPELLHREPLRTQVLQVIEEDEDDNPKKNDQENKKNLDDDFF